MRGFSFLVILLLGLLIASCSPQKRLQRLLLKHPDLVKIDSVKITDTIILPPIRTTDTIDLTEMPDTLVIEKEKVRIEVQKFMVEGKPKLVFKTEYKQDTVVVTRMVPTYELQPYEKPKNYWYMWVLVGILGTLIIFIIANKIPKT